MLPTPRRGRCTARRACGSGPACRSPAPCERHRGQGQGEGQGQGRATRAGASKRRQRGQAGSARVQAKAQPPGASPVPRLVTCRYSDAAPRVRCGGKGAHSRELLWPQSWNKSTVWCCCAVHTLGVPWRQDARRRRDFQRRWGAGKRASAAQRSALTGASASPAPT